jgi:hypothetical protein
MELVESLFKVLYSIFLAIYCILVPGGNKSDGGKGNEREGFVSLPGLRSKSLSLYPNKDEVSASGGDDRYRVFEPYLRQTERENREQRDNHRWPIGRTLTGSLEQLLSSSPVLPCAYPRPTLGGNVLHTKEDAIMRNKLTHSPVMF